MNYESDDSDDSDDLEDEDEDLKNSQCSDDSNQLITNIKK